MKSHLLKIALQHVTEIHVFKLLPNFQLFNFRNFTVYIYSITKSRKLLYIVILRMLYTVYDFSPLSNLILFEFFIFLQVFPLLPSRRVQFAAKMKIIYENFKMKTFIRINIEYAVLKNSHMKFSTKCALAMKNETYGVQIQRSFTLTISHALILLPTSI